MYSYVFSEKLKFVVLKIDKTASKILNKQEYGQSEYEIIEAFERVIALLLQTIFNFFKKINQKCCCSTRLCQKVFLMASLLKNHQKCKFWAFFHRNS